MAAAPKKLDWVTLLVRHPPLGNSTTLQNSSICYAPLYFTVTLEQIMKFPSIFFYLECSLNSVCCLFSFCLPYRCVGNLIIFYEDHDPVTHLIKSNTFCKEAPSYVGSFKWIFKVIEILILCSQIRKRIKLEWPSDWRRLNDHGVRPTRSTWLRQSREKSEGDW